MKIQEVIDRILAYHPDFGPGYDGCDNVKCGDTSAECTGVVCALVPTIDVIRETIRLGANLIVVHEPTFYTSKDENGWFEDFDNPVYAEKQKMLDDAGIVIWRDHDHMHAHDPDSIFTGVLKYSGWLEGAEKKGEDLAFAHYIVRFAPKKLSELIDEVLAKFDINGLRYVGNPDAVVSSLAFVGHLYPMGDMENEYSVRMIEVLEKDVDVILPGETIDWTVLSYVRDAMQLGKNKAVIAMGHFNFEELGMKYMKDWLEELVEGKVTVTYVPSRDIFNYARKG